MTFGVMPQKLVYDGEPLWSDVILYTT